MKSSVGDIEKIQDLLLGVGNQAAGKNQASESIGKINILLIKNSHKKLEDSEFLELVKRCIDSLVYDEKVSQNKIADVIQALAMLSPAQAHLMLNYLTEVFTAKKSLVVTDFYSTVYKLIRGTWSSEEHCINFVQGVILGVFQASNYLDETNPKKHYFDFNSAMISFLEKIILFNKVPRHDFNGGSDLSTAIAKYCGSGKLRELELLFEALERQISFLVNDNNPLAEMLTNQLSHKLFSTLTSGSKILGIIALMRRDSFK
jgi:hypothetical protein